MGRKTREEIEQDRYEHAWRENSIQCMCSNRVHLAAFKRYNGEFAVCEWCGHRVYRDEEKRKGYEFKVKLSRKLNAHKYRVVKLSECTLGEAMAHPSSRNEIDFDNGLLMMEVFE